MNWIIIFAARGVILWFSSHRNKIYPTQWLPCHYISLHHHKQHKGVPAHRLDTLSLTASEELLVIFIWDRNGI